MRVETSHETAPVYPDVASNPLCQRVAEIRTRAELRRAPGTVANPESEPAATDCLTEGLVSTSVDLGSTREPMEFRLRIGSSKFDVGDRGFLKETDKVFASFQGPQDTESVLLLCILNNNTFRMLKFPHAGIKR